MARLQSFVVATARDSKGVIRKLSEHESEFYIIISGKRSTASD